jgi:hypothetical protein
MGGQNGPEGRNSAAAAAAADDDDESITEH